MIKNKRTPSTGLLQFIVVALLLFCRPVSSFAQIELSNSIDLGYPLLINSFNENTFYEQLAVGMRFGVSYKPSATQFYPTLDYSFGRTRLPLKQFQSNVAYLNYGYSNLMLKGNFVMNVFYTNTLFLSLGIGFDRLKDKGPGISGHNAGQMFIHEDSSANVDKYFPAIGVGLEYVYGESVGQKVFLSVGGDIHCTIFFPERNNYDVYVRDAQRNDVYLQGAIQGRAFTPSFHITLHYMLGDEIFFWDKKKKDK